MVEITPAAQEYLVGLLSKQDDATDIRIFISDPGTPMAETCIAYCKPGEEQTTDEKADYTGFGAWIDERSKPFLVDAYGDAYFIARIKPTNLEALQPGVIAMLSVGQAAKISIKSSERSVLAFLLGPLIRGSSQVFTEC